MRPIFQSRIICPSNEHCGLESPTTLPPPSDHPPMANQSPEPMIEHELPSDPVQLYSAAMMSAEVMQRYTQVNGHKTAHMSIPASLASSPRSSIPASSSPSLAYTKPSKFRSSDSLSKTQKNLLTTPVSTATTNSSPETRLVTQPKSRLTPNKRSPTLQKNAHSTQKTGDNESSPRLKKSTKLSKDPANQTRSPIFRSLGQRQKDTIGPPHTNSSKSSKKSSKSASNSTKLSRRSSHKKYGPKIVDEVDHFTGDLHKDHNMIQLFLPDQKFLDNALPPPLQPHVHGTAPLPPIDDSHKQARSWPSSVDGSSPPRAHFRTNNCSALITTDGRDNLYSRTRRAPPLGAAVSSLGRDPRTECLSAAAATEYLSTVFNPVDHVVKSMRHRHSTNSLPDSVSSSRQPLRMRLDFIDSSPEPVRALYRTSDCSLEPIRLLHSSDDNLNFKYASNHLV